MKSLIYLFSLLAPRQLRAAWREEWLAGFVDLDGAPQTPTCGGRAMG